MWVFLFTVLLFVSSNCLAQHKPLAKMYAELSSEPEEVSYFFLSDGSMKAFPKKLVTDRTETARNIVLSLYGDTTVTIPKKLILRETDTYDEELPVFESFKFNNKFNDQLFTDAIGTIDNDQNRIDVEAAVIGKRLTPSFKTPDWTAVYVGTGRQYSKETSQRFDKDITYTLAKNRHTMYNVIKTQDEVWEVKTYTEGDQWLTEQIALTEEMLSTNAPSNHGDELGNMLDDDPTTIFHSTWGTGDHAKLAWYEGAYYGDGQSEWPYIQFDLPEAVYDLKLCYTVRNTSNYAPLGFIIQGSDDGNSWTDLRTFTQSDDNLPTEAGSTYESPVFSLGKGYSHLRLQLTAAAHKNYLVMSELSMYSVTENPDYEPGGTDSVLVQPAIYERGFMPIGRDYTVHVDFKTDHSTSEYSVPIIRINTRSGQDITSKTVYQVASFELDGAGIWDDIYEDSMEIKGRGNSTWSYSKKPYRLKFPTKIKPFGLTKGKSWVLLANAQSGAMTTNAFAYKTADMVGTVACNHVIPVELYLNGTYRGSYNFTEKIGFANNSIDIEDESNAVILELDSYYDETYKFRDGSYSLCTNIKEPDLSDTESGTNLTFEDIQSAFNSFTSVLKQGGEDYVSMVDVDKLVRAMFVTDLIRNCEYKHPKSWYLYNENIYADSLWVLGPVWDFDWSYGYDGTYSYYVYQAESDLFDNCSGYGVSFFKALLRNSATVRKAYYELWTKFMTDGSLTELLEWCDDYYQFASKSLVHNATKWSDGNGYATSTEKAKSWLKTRAEYIYSNLEKFICVPESYDVFAGDSTGESLYFQLHDFDELIVSDSYCMLSVPQTVQDISLSYVRDFKTAGIWQAWYMPFDVDIATDLADFDVARLNTSMSTSDCIIIDKLESGTASANTPYFIRLKDDVPAGRKLITSSTTELKKTEINPVHGGQMTIMGTYSTMSGNEMQSKDAYALSGGKFCKAKSSAASLGAFRFYMQADGGNEVRIRMTDGTSTDICRTGIGQESQEQSYSVSGVQVSDSYRGIVIRNGKKILVK